MILLLRLWSFLGVGFMGVRSWGLGIGWGLLVGLLLLDGFVWLLGVLCTIILGSRLSINILQIQQHNNPNYPKNKNPKYPQPQPQPHQQPQQTNSQYHS